MIEKAFRTNKDGAGIASREKILDEEGKERIVVKWKKGLDLDQIKEEIFIAELPFVAHFRIASCGGVRTELTHPFSLNSDQSLDLEGITEEGVLFHNGHWAKWKEFLLETCLKMGVSIPVGRWSDTRAMAFLTKLYGPGFMDFIEEKGVLFTPDDMDVFSGATGWKKIDGIWCSNDHFTFGNSNHSFYYGQGTGYVSKYCKNPSCSRLDIDSQGWCPIHQGMSKNTNLTAPTTKVETKKEEVKGPVEKAAEILAGEVKVEAVNGNKQPGGAATENPFTMLDDLYLNEVISHKQFKKIKGVLLAGEKTKHLCPGPLAPIGNRLPH